MARGSRPTTLTLSKLHAHAKSGMKPGAHASAGKLRRWVAESLNDPRPSIPARTVFKHLRKRHATNVGRDDAQR